MGTLLKYNIDIETQNQKSERQKDNKTKDDEQDSEDAQTTFNDLLSSKKGGWVGGGAVSSRFFDLLNSMMYDLKRSADIRQLFGPVLHSSLDDHVLIFFGTYMCNEFFGAVEVFVFFLSRGCQNFIVAKRETGVQHLTLKKCINRV